MPRAPVFYEARKSARGDRATLADARRPHPLRAQHPVPRWHHRQFEPLNFPARLASLVPSPRVNLMRFHGVFAANHRAQIAWRMRDQVAFSGCPAAEVRRTDGRTHG
jgi:hypothetical protein